MRKVSHIVSDGARMVNVTGKDVSQAPSIAALLSYIEQTEYDDMDGLKLDYRVLPRYAITTTSRECLKRNAPSLARSASCMACESVPNRRTFS